FVCKLCGKVGQISLQINMGHFARKMTHVALTYPNKNKDFAGIELCVPRWDFTGPLSDNF
ncbi:MAG: hypothetical protein V4476_24155, partial [Pseudomonadota bacterium]